MKVIIYFVLVSTVLHSPSGYASDEEQVMSIKKRKLKAIESEEVDIITVDEPHKTGAAILKEAIKQHETIEKQKQYKKKK